MLRAPAVYRNELQSAGCAAIMELYGINTPPSPPLPFVLPSAQTFYCFRQAAGWPRYVVYCEFSPFSRPHACVYTTHTHTRTALYRLIFHSPNAFVPFL